MKTSRLRTKRFEDMSRAELEAAKQYYQQQVSQVNQQIGELRADFARIGKTANPVTDYPGLSSQKTNLSYMLSRIDRLLSRKNSRLPVQDSGAGSSEAVNFMKMAKELLDPDLYQHILESARGLK